MSDKKKAQKPKSPYKFQDDKGMVIEPEQYFALLQKKLKTVASQAETPVPAQLLKQIKDVFEGEDKSRQGIPFSQLALSNVNTPQQLYVSMTILQTYEPLRYLYLHNIQFDAEFTKGIILLIKQAQKYTVGGLHTIELTACKVDSPLINDILAALPLSKLRTITFQHMQIDNSNLETLATGVEKYVEQCQQKAQAAIDEAVAKFEEMQEKLASAKKGKKGKKGKKMKDQTHLQTVDQKYMEYFTLANVNIRYAGLGPANAVQVGNCASRIVRYIERLDLSGNPLTSLGIGEIGAGLERAYMRVRDLPSVDPEKDAATVFSGSRLINLRALVLRQCGFQEDLEDAFRRFGRGVVCCGNLQQLDLQQNLLKDADKDLWPQLLLQKQLIVSAFERSDMDHEALKNLYNGLKEHQKLQQQAAKAAKAAAKAKKKAAKEKPKAEAAAEAPPDPDALLAAMAAAQGGAGLGALGATNAPAADAAPGAAAEAPAAEAPAEAAPEAAQ